MAERLVLRADQERMVRDVRHAFGSGAKAVLLVAPTGAGKTVVFSYAAHAALNKNQRVLILVHRRRLIRQTSRTLERFGVPHGVIAAGISPDWHQPVQVASVQTMASRLAKITWRPTFVIIDEAHHTTPNTAWGRVMAHCQAEPSPALVLGVTATPERLDGHGLGVAVGGVFDQMVIGPSVMELIDLGHLSRPVVYAPPIVADISRLRTTAGEYNRKDAADAMDRPSITGDAVEHYRRLCPGAPPAIVFCSTVAHAEHVAEQFGAGGFRAESVSGSKKDEENERILNGLGDGTYQVVASCDLISEGTDIPVVAAAILLSPTQSVAKYLQQVGRALRTYPGKTHATILDHVGSWARHGLPDSMREWDLNAAKRKRKKKVDDDKLKIRQCEKCYTVHEFAPICPACGFVYEVKRAEIEVVAGELEEVTEDRAQELIAGGQKVARSYDELKALGKLRGYKPGWARFVWQARKDKAQHKAERASEPKAPQRPGAFPAFTQREQAQ